MKFVPTPKYRPANAYRGMGVRHHASVIMAQDANEQSISHFSPFTFEEKTLIGNQSHYGHVEEEYIP
jgi:hypothetical protein